MRVAAVDEPPRLQLHAEVVDGLAGTSAASVTLVRMLCPMTGSEHRLFWMRSAWWCHDCRQKIESCCEGGGCPSVAELQR